MHNVNWSTKGDTLTITIDLKGKLTDHPLSKSGKTHLVASTYGPQPVAWRNTARLSVLLNVMYPAKGIENRKGSLTKLAA